MKQLFFQTISAVAIVWAIIFALGLSGCIVEQSTAYRAISGKAMPGKTLRMPASLNQGVRV